MVKVTGDIVLITRDIPAIENDNSIVSGKVIAKGKGFLSLTGNYVPLDVEIGDTVYFHSRDAEDVNFDGEDCSVIKATNIYAIK